MTLLLLAAGVRWMQAQQELATIEIEAQMIDAGATDQPLARQAFVPADVQGAEIVELGNGWARVRVLVKGAHEGSVYRQTRLYQQQGAGWQRVAPSANRWGRSQQLESHYFIFRYFAQDEDAVAAAAPILDAIYPTFHAALIADAPASTNAPPTPKIIVMVDPTRASGLTVGQAGAPDVPLTLPSPSATLARIEVTEEALLVQGVALALFDHLAAQSELFHDLPVRWRRLHDALRLWLLWDQELPLATWREPLVRWVFWADEGIGTKGAASTSPLVPAFLPELCADQRLWMSTQAAIGGAVLCFARPDGEEGSLAFRYPIPPPLTLPGLQGEGMDSPSTVLSTTEQPLPSTAIVAFATLFEYVSASYGAEGSGTEKSGAAEVRALMAAIPTYESWETLIPALFARSKGDFEAGWNAFLAEEYGLAH